MKGTFALRPTRSFWCEGTTDAAIGRMRLAGLRFSGVEAMLPSLGYLDMVPKTHLGSRGALQLVESVLNGLLF